MLECDSNKEVVWYAKKTKKQQQHIFDKCWWTSAMPQQIKIFTPNIS